MASRTTYAIVGMGCTNFVEHWDNGLDNLEVEAANDAYTSAGIRKDKVDARLVRRAPAREDLT